MEAVVDPGPHEREGDEGRLVGADCPPGPPVAATIQPLPDELVALVGAYDRIRRVMDRSPKRRARSHEMAEGIKALPIESLSLANRLHLSRYRGERLSAVVDLEKHPDPKYLHWLSERPLVESRFTGIRSTYALEAAATHLPAQFLDEIEYALTQTAGWLEDRNDERDHEMCEHLESARIIVADRTVRSKSSGARGQAGGKRS